MCKVDKLLFLSNAGCRHGFMQPVMAGLWKHGKRSKWPTVSIKGLFLLFSVLAGKG